MFEGDDFTLPYMIPDPEGATKQIETRLAHAYARSLNAIIKWYYSQPTPTLQTWFTLTAVSFQTWYDNSRAAEFIPDVPVPPVIPPPPPAVVIPVPTKTFCSNIKINLTDYPKTQRR